MSFRCDAPEIDSEEDVDGASTGATVECDSQDCMAHVLASGQAWNCQMDRGTGTSSTQEVLDPECTALTSIMHRMVRVDSM